MAGGMVALSRYGTDTTVADAVAAAGRMAYS
jgi:hypothetical protein